MRVMLAREELGHIEWKGILILFMETPSKLLRGKKTSSLHTYPASC